MSIWLPWESGGKGQIQGYIVMITIGTGMGSDVMINGVIRHGASGSTRETLRDAIATVYRLYAFPCIEKTLICLLSRVRSRYIWRCIAGNTSDSMIDYVGIGGTLRLH